MVWKRWGSNSDNCGRSCSGLPLGYTSLGIRHSMEILNTLLAFYFYFVENNAVNIAVGPRHSALVSCYLNSILSFILMCVLVLFYVVF